ncbi:leucyl aminopeptidase [Planococcus lenghuensis]|uniref:Probable cytosol aminopeptidase n=1 Tax=Planococcus lenghuensis TaxID=2213202 RepID=A0A1Q2KX81_9BACL|nr:leucyl aminopeptidase [Planococcus lenghuensis]AQQ52714.1 leucyl aminopeptidase [Planococcus lenghuensis]
MNIEVLTDQQDCQADVLIVGLSRQAAETTGWGNIEKRFEGRLNGWIENGLSDEVKALTEYPALTGEISRVLFIGLGERKELTEDTLRTAFGLAGQHLKKKKAVRAAIHIDSFTSETITADNVAYLATEGIRMGSYQYSGLKTNAEEGVFPEEAVLLTSADAEETAAAALIGSVFADAVNEARTLVNMPANVLTAVRMAAYAEELADEYGFETEILGKQEMEERGMGAILAVNQGSVEEPRLIVLKYKATEDFSDPLALVGKGITFDTGGYSLKPKDGIVGMKGDMGGAAAVLGAMRIIGELKPKKNVMAVIASTDNMVSGNAFKPDDVITSLSGKTIEILNTDAEGRLVLADAVTYAKQLGASRIVNVATLTGGVIVALGMDKTGALTNDEAFFETFLEAAVETDEFVWRLPLTENDRKRLRKSDVADLNNSPGRDGHMIFGGGFVGEFVGDTPWIHLDIAGTSNAASAHDLGPKGGTGVMVRTLAMLVEQLAETEE